MHFVTAISLKNYILFTVLTTLISFLICNGQSEIFGVFIVYFSTIINHILLIELVYMLTENAKGSTTKLSRKKIVFCAIGKMAILAMGLTFGVQLMGKRVIIAVLNYVIQIFILVLSIKKT
ncbi:MAG: hypothetical protein H6622_03315 [Halobacteriovoraceae bacterium]|nr:hypothetical protein [Halobacteriovoraceae bacterium]